MLTTISTTNRQHGFTFLEVITVTVIVAILAAIAMPIYNSNINSKRKDVVDQLAQTAAVSANAYWRRTGAHPGYSDLNLFLPHKERFLVSVDGDSRTIRVKDTTVSPSIVSDPAEY